MKIDTLIVIAETDNGKFHQVLLPESVKDSIFKILADFGTIKLLQTELELEMVNRKKHNPMTHFKTSKAELLFVVLPKGAYDVKISQLIGDRQKIRTRNESMPLPQGNWQLIGKLSEVSEEVAKGLVDAHVSEWFTDKFYYKNYIEESKIFDNAIESLNSIATHLGMELTDNIYLLKKI